MQIEKQPAVKFKKDLISYADTGFFGGLILDYLSGNDFLEPFYNRPPALDSFGGQIAEKTENYKIRAELCQALKGQYSSAKLPVQNVLPLESKDAFTITTGHQVCLFTGPLYFLFKIVSVINTCKALKTQHTDKDFVPVFWMATEDHDFEEANHFITPEGKVEWESGQGGAVGRMKTEGTDALIAELKAHFGLGYRAAELVKLFEDAYVKHDTIAAATRWLVHQLFGKYGVVVVDGDDPALKALVAPLFLEEAKNQISFEAVTETSQRLSENYKTQVMPREINLFYLADQLRERIVQNDRGDFEVLNSDIVFTTEELEKELQAHPENFSPNVILRPLYQEVILPNLAYIGGGGELAYWFQLKDMFDKFGVTFPVLMLRNSVGVLSQENTALMDEISISIPDLFSTTLELENKILAADDNLDLSLEKERKQIEDIFADMAARLGETDSTLVDSVSSGLARTTRITSNLEKKLKRAERKKHSQTIEKFERLNKSFVVNGGLQERVYNYSFLYMAYGEGLIDELLESLDPFDFRFTVLSELKMDSSTSLDNHTVN